MSAIKVTNSKSDELIAHFMRVKWYGIKNYRGPGCNIINQHFLTKQACEKHFAKANKLEKDKDNHWWAAPGGLGQFELKYKTSWNALVPVIKHISQCDYIKKDNLKNRIPHTLFLKRAELIERDLGSSAGNIGKVYKVVVAFVSHYMKWKGGQNKKMAIRSKNGSSKQERFSDPA